MFCNCGSRSDGINKGGKKTGSQQKTGKRDGHSGGMADRCYLSLRPVGMMVSSLKIHNFSALFLCPMVQWSSASRPEIVKLVTGCC